MERQQISSGSTWEPVVGYSRAVRAGETVHVSGTVGVREDGTVASGDVYEQARQALFIIGRALEEAGASFVDVVRTRIYVTDISQWQEAGRAHAEVFGDIRPATTMVEVSRLIGDDVLVEIEAEAIVGE